MDAVTHAINDVKYEIPEEILNDAFIDRRSRYMRRPQSLDAAIRETIIDRRIKPDLDNLGGVMVVIDLNGVPYEKLSNYERIYTIPRSKTMGRTISQVLRVGMNVTSNYQERIPGQSSASFQISPVERSIQSVVASHNPIPNISNAEVEMLGDNTFKINDYQNFTTDISLECLISYTKELSELKRPYFRDFSQLVVLAVKAYIYKELSLKLDRTRLEGGRDFGRYKEIVDEYRDANQMYNDLLDEKWAKLLLLNDQNRKQKHIIRAGSIRY
jgi:hypothetical protein